MTDLETELLHAEIATLKQLLEVHEEQATKQFETIRAQQKHLEERARTLDEVNQALTKNTTFLSELYRAMPSLLIVVDSTGAIVGANHTTLSTLDYDEAELLGRPIADVLVGARLPHEQCVPGTILRTEQELISKSGVHIPILLYVAVSAAADRRLVCVGLDVRDRLRLEMELRQAQKLESIGRLAAGVAHEINTPIQFVTDSINFLKAATGDLLSVLDQLSQASLPEALATALEDADVPYLRTNIAPAIESSLEGLRRVTHIVRSMKEFAHPEGDTSSVDLNNAIETTLTIAATEYNLVADVHTTFGELPPVDCHAGDLNQVFLNLIVNASHAIADRFAETGQRGVIRIGTRCQGEHVVVEIGDTGGGIPIEIQNRIYDPFFTTKEVGKGTGQGLAIARSVVVDKHGGELRFDSELGRGTTFFVTLPVERARVSQVAHDS